ncbi:MAG TPA: DEAD/DEAH box helicase [Anaerolineae bacterium]|nr:DEAD/DEAH box helicase [Anaerolineae bacterium]
MNPFEVLAHVQEQYRTYVQTFQRFQNSRIEQWIGERLADGTLLWKPPYVQLSRPFAAGEPFADLVAAGILHPRTPGVFRRAVDDPASLPYTPHRHQTEAVRRILSGKNVIVATGTGSGKSFTFGIPIVSEALRMRERGILGIKAVIIYPMNALANSQYDDFAARLHGSGLTIARYTGDTLNSSAEALEDYRRVTQREQPYSSEVLSREDIQNHPPDILMTNYVMLELLLTRFEDRKLFRAPGVLRFLVLDEVHTYTGKRGADVAALIRRLKQHTGTVGALRCIATSATVESTGAESATEAVAHFAQDLFGEPFAAQDVITESYAPLPAGLPPLTYAVAESLAAGPQTVPQLAAALQVTPQEIEQSLVCSRHFSAVSHGAEAPTTNIKLHAFFSQGRAITACLRETHLNDRGERLCPTCTADGQAAVPTFPLVFCRACGQEYWSVAMDDHGQLHPADLDAVDVSGRLGYLLPEHPGIDLPNHWLTPTGKVRGGASGYEDVVPEPWWVCPDCGMVLNASPNQPLQNPKLVVSKANPSKIQNPPCLHPHARPFTFLPAPFLLCPTCGIVHDRRSREYNKLFIFGSVGRSTATDVLVSAQVQALPAGANKVIAFSDNRQDTALQAAHMNSLHHHFTFRRTLYTALDENGYMAGQSGGVELAKLGSLLFETQQRNHSLPRFEKSQRIFGRDRQAEGRYQRYLEFVTLQELGGTHRRTHQNLEDVGLLEVGYSGLDECAAADDFWGRAPLLLNLPPAARYDVLLGLLDIMRKRLALRHAALLEPVKFRTEVIDNLHEDAYIHDEEFHGPIGYSDTAEQARGYTVHRLTGTNTQPVAWVRRAFAALGTPLEHSEAVALVTQIVEKLGDPRAEFLVQHTVTGYGRQRFDLWMVNPAIVTLRADQGRAPWRCPKCGTVHRFQTLRVCSGLTCRTTLEKRDLTDNYFRQVYARPLGTAVPVQAEEHSGQVEGQERREIEVRFKNPEDPLNALICTPTMELGIDIGHLNAVTLRNVPPSPSNYAQRAGRAGRSGQASLVTVFAGVGSARGPHDQYFYRFPEKMIAGAIAAPRFRLDNRALITAHIHALVLETLGLKEAARMPGVPQELLNLDAPGFPFYADWQVAYQRGIEQHLAVIVSAVTTAFAQEIAAFAWFDAAFVETTVRHFLPDLDRALARWRDEYTRLDAEREALNRQLGREGVDRSLNRRRVVIEAKLDAMRRGERDWYLYRYLGGEGFLPGYAFPPEATALAFDDREDELARDPVIALTEYAPGNFVYYRGQRYEIAYARPRSRQAGEGTEAKVELDVAPVLVCPDCERAYTGPDEVKRARCECGADLTTQHPHAGMALTDMYARARARITADEEERLRLGYDVTAHYRAGGQRRVYACDGAGGDQPQHFTLTLEHNGEVLLINRGQREREGDPQGFTLCRKCYRWLVGDNAVQDHLSTPQKRGDCPRNASQDDLERGLWLTHAIRSDLALFAVPLPTGVDPEPFYTTLLHTLLRALLVAFNLDEREVAGFLAPAADDAALYRVVLYETSAGGSGVLAALREPERLRLLLARARELLHAEGAGCEKACYECLLSFYNQRDHDKLDRTLVLPWLQALAQVTVTPVQDNDAAFAQLAAQCQSDLERRVLQAIRDRGLSLPDQAQTTLYDRDGSPIAIADFYYERGRIVVFVDGSPHHQDYVQAADARKRRQLKALNYRVVVVKAEVADAGLDALAALVGQ